MRTEICLFFHWETDGFLVPRTGIWGTNLAAGNRVWTSSKLSYWFKDIIGSD